MQVLYKTQYNLMEMDIVRTNMYIQREGDCNPYVDYENCYVYVSRDGKYYVQINDSEWNECYNVKYKYGILITDLADENDIKTLNFHYGTYILSEEKIKELFENPENETLVAMISRKDNKITYGLEKDKYK